MPDGSLLDVCAVLGAMRDRDAGGLLSAKPRRKGSAVRGLDDLMINVPALMWVMLMPFCCLLPWCADGLTFLAACAHGVPGCARSSMCLHCFCV